jgi:hypothetical protein
MNDTQSSDKWYLNENLCNISSMLKIIRRHQHKNLIIPQMKLVPKDLKRFENIFLDIVDFQYAMEKIMKMSQCHINHFSRL